MKNVNVYSNDVASVSDVMQLVSRLPYLDACDFADAVGGDVDKIVTGARVWLEAEDEETTAAKAAKQTPAPK